jgi:perosamine synthetase
MVKQAEEKFGTKIWTIEDAAEVQGQHTHEGLPCGSLGDVGIFSFYPNKQVTSGEGGMVVTDNEEAFQSAFNLRNLGFNAERRFVHTKLGYNYRMTNLQAAVGLAQVERLEEAVQIRRNMGQLYTRILSERFGRYDVCKVKLPRQFDEVGNENIYWVYMLEVTDDKIEASEVIKALGRERVGTRPCFWPMHAQPVFTDVDSRHFQKHFMCESFPNADRLARQTFYIPSGLALTEDDISIVCTRLEQVLRRLGLLVSFDGNRIDESPGSV